MTDNPAYPKDDVPSHNADKETLILAAAEAIYRDQVEREGFSPLHYSAVDWYYEAKVAVETVLAHIGRYGTDQDNDR